MSDQLILEEPSAKKPKMASPSLMTPSTANDFGFDWGGSVLDLPDELLETSSSNDPTTSTAETSGRTNVNHDSCLMPSSSTPASSSSFNCTPNGPCSTGGPILHSSPLNSSSFSSGQQHHPQHAAGLRAPPPFGPAAATSNCGNSVLEELLLTNRAPSSSGVASASASSQQLHPHHQQQQQGPANPPNVALASASQRTPSNAGMPPPPSFATRSPMNNILSPQNGPVPNNAGPPRSVAIYSADPPVSNAMYGGAPSQYAMPQARLTAAGSDYRPQQAGSSVPQQLMVSGGTRGPQPQSVHGPQINAGVPGSNMVRVTRPANVLASGPPPNQQVLPFSAPLHIQQQQHHANAVGSMSVNANRMNGPNVPNMHMSGHGSYQQDSHAAPSQQPFGVGPPQQQPPMAKLTSMPPGLRPKLQQEFSSLQQTAPPPAVSTQSTFPPQPGVQLPPPPSQQRSLGPRIGFTPSSVNMLTNNNSVAHAPAPSNAEMVGGSSMNSQHMSGQLQAPNSNQGPPLTSLPQQSPVASMLMSPSNNMLNGAGGPLSVPPLSTNDSAGVGQGGSVGASSISGGAPQDPEKRKLIQQQLVLLLHAHKCQQRERTNDQQQCALPHCSTMKAVLTHMTTCNEGRSCTVPHCASSRQIIAHWKSCIRADCPVCLPLKQMTDNKNNRGAAGPVPSNGPLPLDTNSVNGPRFPGRTAAVSNFDAFMGHNVTDNLPGVHSQLRASAPGRPRLPVSSAASGTIAGSAMFPGSIGSDGGSGSFQPRWPPPEGASVQKEWHKQVTIDLRNHLVSKLVKAIFPSPDPAAMHDQRIKDLIQYARKVEKEMFELANDREEYYHLLAEKIYKIQKELQEKKQRRLEAQIRCHGPAGSGAPASGTNAPFDLASMQNKAGSLDSLHRAPVTAAALSTQSAAGNNGAPSAGGGGFVQSGPNVKTEDGAGAHCRAGSASAGAASKLESHVVKTEAIEAVNNSEKATRSPGDTAAQSKAVAKATKKVFTVDELTNALLPVWNNLERMEDAIPFRVPVDPDLLGIPDYFDIIKNPMDLSTIKEKLVNGDYTDPWQFCDDMWLMFDNAWLYNRKNSRVYKYCTKLSETFMDQIDPVMRSLGYCCGRKLAFTPLALVCYGQPMCAIPRDSIYYCYEETKSQFGVSSERYTYCKKCFEEIPGDSINMSDDPNPDNLIPKKNFKQLKNDQIEYEPFLECVDCGRKWHQICALHMDQIYHGGFLCETCVKAKAKKRPENRFTAKRMAHCKLSQHLEKRVNDYLKNKIPPDTPAGDVIIRVLSSSDKEVDVKPHMKSKFCTTGQFPEKFPYKAKAIFAFEVIDGVEVCFFGLHVQEFGTNCPSPNQRRVYIAYLDSVHFFTPKCVRTQVYHEILLGYLDYVKKMGYTMAHIWACPPSEGDDYIFHCHPLEQKIPKPKRLQEWYKKMLDRGVVERTVTDYKDIYEFYLKEEPLTSVTELPFFEGDYWPNVVEECIREVDAEEAERKREAEAQAAAGAAPDDIDDDTDELFGQGKKRNAKGHKKNRSKSKSTNYKKSKKGGSGTGNDLSDKILAALEKHKEVFFVVRLYSKQSAAALPNIVDPDPHITCEFMDGRDSFLSTARDRHWEFSSLRRAKFSTLALCYELHTQGSDKFVYTCNTCKNTNANWHCSECDDFDLCQTCYEKSHHEHKMEPIKSIMADDSSSNQEQGTQNPRDRNESIQRCIQSLVHACQCRDANCRRLSCHKMKRVVQHTKNCKKRQSGSCPVCKQLIALCLYHARHCQEANCPVPFCQNIRQKLAEQQAQLKKKRDREMMRRINFMSNQAAGGPNPAIAMAPATPYQQNPQPSPLAMGSMISPTPGMSGTSVSGVPPPVNPTAMLVARDIEKIAAQQQQVVGGYQNVMGGRMLGPRTPGPAAVGGMYGGMGQPNRMPASSVPPQSTQQQQQQQPVWDGVKPGNYHHPSMAPMNAPQQQHPRMPPPMGLRPGLVPADTMTRPSGMRTLSAAQQQKVTIMLQRMRSARSAEERESILKEMQQDPLVLQTILRAFERSGQQPPAQLQQQSWNGPMMTTAGVGSQQPRPNPQQQYYTGSSPAGVRMVQQQPGPQGYSDLNGPRHVNYANSPAGYVGPPQHGGVYGNAGLRQPISPQTSTSLPSANLLNQVRSPQTSSMASPSPAGIHSPHIGAASMMHVQSQLPPNIMADQSGNDALGGDQNKFL